MCRSRRPTYVTMPQEFRLEGLKHNEGFNRHTCSFGQDIQAAFATCEDYCMSSTRVVLGIGLAMEPGINFTPKSNSCHSERVSPTNCIM